MIKNNKFKYFILILVVSLFGIINVAAATNPYKKGTPWGSVNCTWYAWNMAYEYKGIVLPGWGNAKDWDDDAKRDGYEVGYEPKSNSIIVWEDWTDYGHVGYVTSVDSANDKLYVRASTECRTKPTKEMEDAYDKCYEEIYYSDPNSNQETDRYAHEQCVHLIKTELIPCEYQISEEKSKKTKFIYLDNIPKTPTNNNTTTTVAKSNNANLSSLTISDIDLNFNKNTLKYEAEVNGGIEKVTVSAKAENNKAKINGAGDYELKIGENTINIEGTAENGTKKTYTVSIKKLDSNAFLENLIISNINFEFKKEVFEYNLEVANEINNINIEANTASELSQVEGIGSFNLNIGKNTFDIKVTAEDKTENTYKITINRKEQNQVEEKKHEQTKTNETHKNLIVYIISGIAFIILIVTVTVIIYKKSKKNKKSKD